jgi:Na+-transporting NADH:ubiquinone oxidoreductase subunit F
MGFFVAPLSIAGIAAFLAMLISVVDKIVNNYGECVIDINQGKRKLTVDGGANLLVTLAGQDIFIPSACGGRGSCGECKVKVLSDVGPILPTEVPYLSKEEQNDGVRLSCQVKVKGDIDLAVPDELFSVRRFKGVVERIRDVTHDIKEVYIRLDNPSAIEFTAGQYCQLEVPPYDKIREPTQRAYSMSSVPSDSNHTEFLVRLVPGGIVTTYVHTRMAEGEKVNLVGPFGQFGVRDTNADMICVAGGSGMAPFKSIFYDMIEKGKTDRNVWYFFGARTKKDLFYIDELEDIASKWDKFRFIYALSEPLPEDNWEGETGLITEVLDKYFKEKMDQDTPKEGYLCGSPGMLDACIRVMQDNGMQEEKIYFDKFA